MNKKISLYWDQLTVFANTNGKKQCSGEDERAPPGVRVHTEAHSARNCRVTNCPHSEHGRSGRLLDKGGEWGRRLGLPLMMSSDPHSRASNVVFVDQELQVCSTSGGHGVTSNRPLPPAPHSIPRHSSILCFSGSNLLEPCHLPHYHRRDLPPRSRPLLTSAGCQCRLHFSRAGGCRLCQVQCRQSE